MSWQSWNFHYLQRHESRVQNVTFCAEKTTKYWNKIRNQHFLSTNQCYFFENVLKMKLSCLKYSLLFVTVIGANFLLFIGFQVQNVYDYKRVYRFVAIVDILQYMYYMTQWIYELDSNNIV